MDRQVIQSYKVFAEELLEVAETEIAEKSPAECYELISAVMAGPTKAEDKPDF